MKNSKVRMSQNLHSSWHTICYSLSNVNGLESTPDYRVVEKYQNGPQTGHAVIAYLIIEHYMPRIIG